MKALYNPFTGELFSEEAMEIKEKLLKLKTASGECLVKFDSLYSANTAIVFKAATGTGKGVIIAPHVMELENKKETNKVYVTEPRQANCSSIAKFLGRVYGSKFVNYGFRFDNNLTDSTLLNFVTDGFLVNYFYDNKVAAIKTIIIDEVHERNKNIDQLLAFCRITQKKLIVLSATIDIDFYVKYLEGGKMKVGSMELKADTTHAIKDIYLAKEEDYVLQAVKVVHDIIKSGEKGDIIIFLASAPECVKACKEIRKLKVQSICYELHRGNRDQMEAKLDAESFKDDLVDGQVPDRKIIFSTNVAESGVTIDGLKFIIDSGRRYESVFVGAEGLYELNSKFISKAESDQRRGRVGRTSPGTNYRLFSESDFKNDFPDYKDPEILIEDITDLTLTLLGKEYAFENINKVNELYDNMPNPPSDMQRKFAVRRLKELELITNDHKMTPLGKKVVDMKMDIAPAIVAIYGASYQITYKIARMLAMFSIEPEVKKWFKPPRETDANYKDFLKKMDTWKSSKGEVFILYDIFEEFSKISENQQEFWCKKNYLDRNKLRNAKRQSFKYTASMKEAKMYEKPYGKTDNELIVMSFEAGFRDNFAIKSGEFYEIDRPIGRVKVEKPPLLTRIAKKIIFTEITKINGDVVIGGLINLPN